MSKERLLYFDHTNGKGKILCNQCGHLEDIISFIHGLQETGSLSGYQCQSCGRFHRLTDQQELLTDKKCDCGGDLSRDKPVFCPKCVSKDVSFILGMMT